MISFPFVGLDQLLVALSFIAFDFFNGILKEVVTKTISRDIGGKGSPVRLPIPAKLKEVLAQVQKEEENK